MAMIVVSAAIYTFVSPLSRTRTYLHAAGSPTSNTSPSPVQPSLELGIANALIHARIRLGRTVEQSNSSRVTVPTYEFCHAARCERGVNRHGVTFVVGYSWRIIVMVG
ncbi:hypothetical protein DFH08DRAFT_833432, partial [Mycena albidolilacea]